MRYAFPARSLAIRRTLDGTHLTAIANDPDVRPHLLVPEVGELDLRTIVADPRNYCFETPDGGFLCVALGYGRYEVHSLFTPTRGPKLTVTAMRAALIYGFTRTDCVEVVTKVPEGNRPAGVLAAFAHFQDCFTAPVLPAAVQRARYLSLTIDRWVVNTCDISPIGHWFHEALEHAKAESGSTLATHPDDPVHDRFVGATVLMIANSQAQKAIGFYNSWARWVGYQPMALLSLTPPVLDIGDAIIEARPGEMEVLSCR